MCQKTDFIESKIFVYICIMKERIEDILEEVVICAVLLVIFSLAIPVEIWKWLKGLFHKHKEEKDDAEFHFSYRGNSIEEKLRLLSDHTFDTDTQ